MAARTEASHPSTNGPPGVIDASGSWIWFVGWAGVGALFALAFISMLSIGILVLPVAVLGVTVLTLATNRARPHPPAGAAWGALSGASLPLLFVAYLHRRGPGTVCDVTPRSTHCTELLNPWPWVGVAVILIGAGVGLHVLARRRQVRASTMVAARWGSATVTGPTTNRLARTSLALGVVSMILLPLLGIAGLVTGVIARREIAASAGRERGSGLALGGIITSLAALTFFVAMLAFLFR